MRKFLPAFLLGFLASGFQIYLLREFSVHFYGNEMTYGLVLGSWLLWGGLGSIFASRGKVRSARFTSLLLTVVAVFPLCLAALRLSRFPLHLLPGEITGLSLILPFALGLSLLINFPLGMLFVLAVGDDKENLSRVWIGESLGAALGGITVSLVLMPYFSNWRGAALVGGAVAAASMMIPSRKKKIAGLTLVFMILAAFWLFDLPSQRLFWKPFPLLASRDTPYGKLQVIKFKEQVSLYSNGLPVFASGDTAAAEESVHFTVLQNPGGRRAVLIGGAAGGGLAEALKYPALRVDYVELDPEIVRLSLAFLPRKEKECFENKRVRVFYKDGRAFLRASRDTYDFIILELPEPANAQVNRFYTREFFRLARARLSASGILAFRLPSSENYISPERQRFLATLYRTLEAVFPRVEVVPGESNVFLASGSPLTLDAEALSRRVESLGLRTIYVRRELLFSRLDPLRVDLLREKLSEAPAAMNTDLEPLSYFYDSILWNSQFRSVEVKLLSALSRIPRAWLLGIPLALVVSVLILIPGRRPGFVLLPLVFLGFTQIVAEVMVLLWFETLYGSVYGRLALLLASFMAGLFAGAILGRHQRTVRRRRPLGLQLGIIVWLAVLFFLLEERPPEALFYVFLLALGFLGGNQFITINRLFLERRSDFGLGYGLDLLGSFVGAVAASSVLIPLAGLAGLALFLVALNLLGLTVMLLKPGVRKSNPG